MSSKKYPSLFNVFTNSVSEVARGIGCLEAIPGRRYRIKRVDAISKYLGESQCGLQLHIFSNNSIVLDTYAYHLAFAIDAAILGRAIYKDQGIGSNVAFTSGLIAGGWVGGTFGAQGGYRAGEYIGELLIGPKGGGYCALIFGYLGGVFGSHFGNVFVRSILPDD